ncbi:pyridoxal phosphate-dependent aminotransferase [Clostridium folliculivorans]|uniref:Aminotransferase n=1 Tax=Clostridium folliculivorans TaxID=2886038 RepID=A0A9W5Y1B2_9CLOT|nr:pyridoxal phosphate-dependent aminotransferase [Clostridium folliculivorans]GKU24724.1 aminotransferase [Clostridium folliculivorans]GKU30822.1 aminotransferase [Clostridium folliculivorans]
MTLSKKIEALTPSITLSITAKANEMKKTGVNVISFAAGEPDFNTPKNIIDSAISAMENGHTKYTPASGLLELKKAVCKKFSDDNQLEYSSSQVIISNGAKQCLGNLFLALLNPGDEVIVPTPYWVSYPELIKIADGVPVYVQCEEADDFKYTIENLKQSLTAKTKALLINSPNNPTGTIYSKEELVEIANFAKENDLYIVSDEIYEKLIYGGEKHFSIAAVSEDTFNRTIVINGLSKTYAMTGWRIGYAAGPENVIKLMSSIQSHMTSNPNTIAQYAAIEALNSPVKLVEDMILEFERRRNYMVDKLNEVENVKIINPSGAFYVMVNISYYLKKKFGETIIEDSKMFSELLLETSAVATVPGIAFGLDDYIRLSYATSIDNIEEGVKRLKSFINKLK